MKRLSRFAITGITLALALVSCGKSEYISAVVKEVRITAAIVSETENDNAVGGAIAGAVIAGPVGAVVGGFAGNADKKIVVREKVLGCKFIAVTEDGESLTFTYGSFGTGCTLLRQEDAITIQRKTYGDHVYFYWKGTKAD